MSLAVEAEEHVQVQDSAVGFSKQVPGPYQALGGRFNREAPRPGSKICIPFSTVPFGREYSRCSEW